MPDTAPSPSPFPSRAHRGARARLLGVSAAAVLLLGSAACGQVDDKGSGGSGEKESPADGAETTLTVYAAASLTEAFNELKTQFETDNPGTTVEFNFAGSSELAQQINEGAPADVFASANPANMDLVTDKGNATGEPEVFVENTLQIAVPPDNPADVKKLADLGEKDVKVALCAEEVPCGAAAKTVMDKSGVKIDPVTEEQDVKAAMTKVELGEVDAALVYKTDVIASGDKVKGIEFPESEKAINDYPIVALKEAPEADLAAKWVELVTSDEGEKVLTDAGFRAP